MNIEYLLFNIFILSFSFIGISLKKNAKYPQLKSSIIAFFFVSVPYIIWDSVVAQNWWYFNKDFILGLYLGSLPFEEVLFFLSVPLSCLLLWVNLENVIGDEAAFSHKEADSTLAKIKQLGALNTLKSVFLEIILIIVGVIFVGIGFINKLWYSASVSVLLIILGIISTLGILRLRDKKLMVFTVCVMGLILVFNGYLTARPVVMYNPEMLSGFNIGTIPIEDFIYGIALTHITVAVYELNKQS